MKTYTIKPLNWESSQYGWVAMTFIYVYVIVENKAGEYHTSIQGVNCETRTLNVKRTLEEAKQAAENHWISMMEKGLYK